TADCKAAFRQTPVSPFADPPRQVNRVEFLAARIEHSHQPPLLNPAQQLRRFLRTPIFGTCRATLPDFRDATIEQTARAAGCLETPQIALDELTLRAGLHSAYSKDSDPH